MILCRDFRGLSEVSVVPGDSRYAGMSVTARAHKPLIWPDITSLGNGTINGIKYFSVIIENTTNCKPLLFLFYN